MSSYLWERVLITGAAGRLGSQLRDSLRDLARVVRVNDIADLGPARGREEVMTGDLACMQTVQQLMADVDVVIHLGAVMVQAPWEKVLPANIIGSYNVFEAARIAGAKRIIYASSNHAVGMYPRTEILDADSPARPDTPYGLSKAFGESLARMYFDKHGIEAVCLRIGSCFPEPKNERMLATWLSHKDFVSLCRRCLEAPVVGYCIAYGMSANSKRWWDNSKVAFLGYQPADNGENFAGALASLHTPFNSRDPATVFQGGDYAFPKQQ